MDVVSSYAWIGWLVLILVFVIVEMLSLDFVFLMLAIGSLGGLISGLFGLPWWAQIAVAAVLSLLLLFLIRPPLLRALRRGGDPTRSNVPALLGTEGSVVQSFGGHDTGLVKLANGEVWTSRLAGDEASAPALEPGSRVTVTAIEGATAVVVPAGRQTHE
ncbi:NfeD family protein [Humibacter ginsenosidimutans]|uniref:NfeD family protein n=1 Tax=Humibacter ginsenosidimutans TaxID=2599293 RepID=A0A5B8LYX0_9MICO|nr:NfeD family protein [Humibacter ginsenosidimutans]QDZ13708.1 NfeD family protein [Humibacter ginsenosidimutans]